MNSHKNAWWNNFRVVLANVMHISRSPREALICFIKTVAMTLILATGAPAFAQAVLSNGTVSIGVNREGDLIYQGIGLTHVPTRGEALAPGCSCEGWGVGDKLTSGFGKAGRSFGVQNLAVESFQSTASTAKSVVKVMRNGAAFLRVSHDFRPAPETSNLFEVTVTIENVAPTAAEIVYRRAMDWDVPPTTFSELVTIVTNGVPDVIYSSDDGFADGNPFANKTRILFSGEATNSGPADHGALFDFNLGRLEPGEKRSFFIYYGAAANEPAALNALASVGAEVYSLGKPNTPNLTPPGSPNTFAFGFKGLGGAPAIVKDADLSIGGLRLIDNGLGSAFSISARVGNAGGKGAGKFNVAFYDGDPSKAGAVLLGSREIQGLAKGKFTDVQIDGIQALSGNPLYAVVDPEKKIVDCSLLNNEVSVPARPAVILGQITVGTDSPKYPAHSPVVFNLAVKNPGSVPYKYSVNLLVQDIQGAVVASFSPLNTDDVLPGQSAALMQAWNTGPLIAGTYQVTATLLSHDGAIVSSNTTEFSIVGANDTSANLTGKITVDKQKYQPSEVVLISDRVTNVTVNALLNDLRIVTTVMNPDGTVRFTTSEVLPQLAQGTWKDYRYSLPLNFATAGQYSATLAVTAVDGTLLAQSATQFAVAPSTESGSGLTGTLVVSPKDVPLGDAVTFTFSASNSGNAALTALPLKVSIVDPATQMVVAEFPYQPTLDVGAGYNAAASWSTSGSTGTTYVAVLTATIGGKTLTLAQDSFRQVAPPVKLDVIQSVVASQRILVLIACDRGEHDHHDHYDDHDHHGDKDGKQHRVALSGYHDSDDDHEEGRHDEACTARMQAITQMLSGLGTPHTIVTHPRAFQRALRSGLYNTYWLSGKQYKLDGTLARELREAVFAGAGLIQDGLHDERNNLLDTIGGVHVQGMVGVDRGVTLHGSLYPTPLSLSSAGKAKWLQPLDGAQVQGTYAVSGNGHHDDNHDYGRDHGGHHKHGGDHPAKIHAAMVSNTYGTGRTLSFGIDLASTLRAAATTWADPLHTGLIALMPPLATVFTPGEPLQVKTSVTNQAKAADLRVTSTLPPNAILIASSPTGTHDASTNTIAWTFGLDAALTQDLFLTLRVPPSAGQFTLQTMVGTIKGGVFMQYGTALTLPITVKAAATHGADAIQALQGLSLSQHKQRKLRDDLVNDLKAALASFNQHSTSGYAEAIDMLLSVADRLPQLAPADIAGIRLQVARMLQEVQWRWTQMPPAPAKGKSKQND